MAGSLRQDLHRRGAEDAEFPQSGLTDQIIAAAIEVHREFGPGLLESIYQQALAKELRDAGLNVCTEVDVPVSYKGELMEASLRLDLLVERSVVVEVKAIAELGDIHRAQLLSYLRLTGHEVGLLINFNVAALRQGIKRIVNSQRRSASSAPLR
jgi:GxxExxY protein